MLVFGLKAPAPDALAVPRRYAYVAERTADDVAIDLVELLPQPSS
jgi:hypothetical protein